jgi:hypothetical protein
MRALDCFKLMSLNERPTIKSASATIELMPASRAFLLTLNDGETIQLPPWQLLKPENQSANALAAVMAHNAVLAVWELMLERFAVPATSDGWRGSDGGERSIDSFLSNACASAGVFRATKAAPPW